MNTLFDSYGRYEIPTLVLCNPNKDTLFSLSDVFDRTLKMRFNAISELTFTAPYKVNEQISPYYSYLDYRRLVLVQDRGYFMITGIQTYDDGVVATKNITASSLEVELSFKKVSLFKGTYKLHNVISSGSPTFLDKVISYAPSWTIGYVDPSLWNIYRTFDESDTNIYSLMMEKAETAYQCVFKFDTYNRIINVYSADTAVENTNIYLSMNNLIENIDINQITSEMVTALNVFGGGDLNIRLVNPLGSNTIYNFDYYKTTDWMSPELIAAIDTWEQQIVLAQPQYAGYLTTLRDTNSSILTKTSELALLQAEYDALEAVRKVRIEQGLSYTDINTQIYAKRSQMNVKKIEIKNLRNVVTNLNDQLAAINSFLSFENNFEPALLSELNTFIIGSTYQNGNFIQTDIMTNVEIQDVAQELYDQANTVLSKLSQPRYEFEVNSVNFVFLPEYQSFMSQLELGSLVSVEVKNTFKYQDRYNAIVEIDEDDMGRDGIHIRTITNNSLVIIKPIVLEIYLNYDNPLDFKITFSNRLRLDNAVFEFGDLFGDSNNSAINTNFNSEQWSSWENNYKDDVSDFITSTLDASRNNLVSSSGQEIVISSNGLQGRAIPMNSSGSAIVQPGGTPVYNSEGKIIYYVDQYDNIIYSNEKVWLTNNTLAFTNNDWQTARLALGKISGSSYGISGSAYGLVADVVVGRLVAGNQLLITNTNSKFLVDASGATLTDGVISITTSNNRNKILLDPVNGIKIQANVGGTFRDRLYADSSGNVFFSGSLAAASGTFTGAITATSGNIGGWSISTSGLEDYTSGNYIRSNGEIKLGLLRISTSSGTATFDGTINADRINGIINGGKIGTGINAGYVSTGTMSANRIGAGVITFSGGSIDMSGTENLRLNADRNIEFTFGGKFVTFDRDFGLLSQDLHVLGNLYSGNNRGVNIGYSVQTPYGTRVLTFQNGILIAYT